MMKRTRVKEGGEKNVQKVHHKITTPPHHVKQFVCDNFWNIQKERKEKRKKWYDIALAVKKHFPEYTSIYSLAEDLSTAFCRATKPERCEFLDF